MSIKSTVLAAVAAVSFALPAFAADIMVEDPYARASSMMSTSGAAFMMIHNHGSEDDHLTGARSDVAERVELHTHKEDANGVMRMMHVEEGFSIPAGGSIALARGGHHVMFLGLKGEMKQDDMITVTLEFEKAGDVVVEVPVDLNRKPMHGQMKHGQMKHGEMKQGDASN